MPDISLPDVHLPDIKLPEGLRDMNRKDIQAALSDRMPKKIEIINVRAGISRDVPYLINAWRRHRCH